MARSTSPPRPCLSMRITAGLELLTFILHPANWADKVPSNESASEALPRWKEEPKSTPRLVSALMALFTDKDVDNARYSGTANAAEAVLQWAGGSSLGDYDEDEAVQKKEVVHNKRPRS
eukprot:5679580-Amphidinium_carterae.1